MAYPITYTSCGVEHVINSKPTRIVTMNQGATEFLLGLGLADHMAGTAYLDDAIWPRYASAYAAIPVLSSSYPNESTLLGANPDFIVASYQSAFRQTYVHSSGSTRGIFSNATIAPCEGSGSEFGTALPTCRPQLHAQGIGTFLFADACEDRSLRPALVSEDTVYQELRTMGQIFNVNAESIIAEMRQDFDTAAGIVSSGFNGQPLKAVWLDCVGRCCSVPEGQEPQVYVGAGTGPPQLLMQEAGLTNVFGHLDGNWKCVNESDIISAAPDVLIVVDAAWDTALSKITWLYNHSEFCPMDALKGARFVQIPFSASTLGPRNAPAAVDLAMAALHVRTGSLTATRESGVGSFSPTFLQSHIEGLTCTTNPAVLVYTDDEEEGASAKEDNNLALGLGLGLGLGIPLILAIIVAAACWYRKSTTKPGTGGVVVGRPVDGEGTKV